ncbi:conserved hypothetical protein, secreted [Candidatus Thiomargarita nelsonii]|uniref:Secreted protein n=1 Tax=Candidatus Thiomargarita nelsonii TaxID=1003181 RepID=A0A0A6P1N6_9GAMM|nr:conserved hypothetical protein, secreted [Candidatus Thiomargarita nelsonii]
MKKLSFLLFITSFIAVTVAIAAQRVPGTKITLIPPDNFIRATQFPGYIRQETGSSIMVTEMPGPFSEVTKGFTKPSLATVGVKLIDKKSIKLNDQDAILLHASQNLHGTEFLKWMLVFGDESETILIVAIFPKLFEDELSASLKASVLSAIWNKDIEVDFFEGVTFRVSEKGKLKISKKIGNSIVLSLNGDFPVRSKDDPLVIVGSSITEAWNITNKKAYARERLKVSIKIIEILKEEDVLIDGLEGIKIIAKGQDMKTNHYRLVYHALLYTKDGYYIFQGFSDFKERNEYEAIFGDILESFKRH